MSDPFFFGYGSLVNRRTHDYPHTSRARVRGWRRIWRHTKLRQLAYLSVVEAPETEIDGLIAAVPNGDWAALDVRERAYARLPLAPEDVAHDHPRPVEVQIYRTRPEHEEAPDTRHPVLLSYLDTVVLGFLDLFGAEGVARFFDTTDGWDAPMMDDRAAPIYPRAVVPACSVRRLIDEHLDRLEVRRFKA